MRTAVIFGKKVEMQGSLKAICDYSAEFGTEFTQDFKRAYAAAGFAPPVVFLLKAAWCMARGYSDAVPAFDQWTSDMEGFTLSGVIAWDGWPADVDRAIADEMFHDQKDGGAGAGNQRR